jgi:hypothetical protein
MQAPLQVRFAQRRKPIVSVAALSDIGYRGRWSEGAGTPRVSVIALYPPTRNGFAKKSGVRRLSPSISPNLSAIVDALE